MPALIPEPRVLVLDHRVLPALLGLRFWDVAAREPVQDGLRVRARIEHARVDAVQNRSGVWHFPRLPGIGVTASPPSRAYTIEVHDAGGRFHGVEFEVLAPAPGGLFDWPYGGTNAEHGSPPDAAAGYVPLFSTASRLAPQAMLVVRAQLWDATHDRPAAWALLEVATPGPNGDEVFLGLADAEGAVAACVPVPFVPLNAPRMPAPERTWSVGVQVFYDPALVPTPAPDAFPNLEAILLQRSGDAADIDALPAPIILCPTEALTLRSAVTGTDPARQGWLLVRPP